MVLLAQLAEYLLNDSENWNLKKINSIVDTNKTQIVNIGDQPDIHVLYWTTWIDDSGVVQFRTDIYNRDSKLKQALEASAPILKY